MIAKIIKVKKSVDTAEYLLNHDRARILDFSGLLVEPRNMRRLERLKDGAERQVLAKDMAGWVSDSLEAQATLNPRVMNKFIHIAISFMKEDEKILSDEAMRLLALEYMERLNLVNTQFIIARHFPEDKPDDEGNPHMHLLINKVDNDGNTLNTDYLYKRSLRLCKYMKYKYGLTFSTNPQKKKTNRRAEKKALKQMSPEDRALAEKKQREKEEKQKAWEKRRKKIGRETEHIVRKCLDKSLSKGWDKFKELLCENDVELIFKQDIITHEHLGIYFRVTDPDTGEDHYFSGSNLGEGLSMGSIQWAFDHYKSPAAELANDIVDILTAGGDSRSLEQDMTDDPEEEKRKRERNAIPKPKSRRM